MLPKKGVSRYEKFMEMDFRYYRWAFGPGADRIGLLPALCNADDGRSWRDRSARLSRTRAAARSAYVRRDGRVWADGHDGLQGRRTVYVPTASALSTVDPGPGCGRGRVPGAGLEQTARSPGCRSLRGRLAGSGYAARAG